MPNILLSAYSGEGPTDERFLGPIIRRTLEEIILDATGQIEVYLPVWLGVAKGETDIISTAKRAQLEGYQILCLHADADNRGVEEAYNQSLLPALNKLKSDQTITLQIVPLIPDRTTEAWMLSDIPMLLENLLTELTLSELGLAGSPHNSADPKEKLQAAVRIANLGKGPHLRTDVSDLYSALGEDINLESLARLPSYQEFRQKLGEALAAIGYLY